jgi:hypothetical protein
VTKASDVIYVTFWTPDYINPVTFLKRSAQKHGVNLVDRPIKYGRSWREVVRKKPRFIFKMMEKFSNTKFIVWIDADSIFVRPPKIFHPRGADVGFRPWQRPKGVIEPVASVLSFHNTHETRIEVNRWATNTELLPKTTQRPEQRALAALMPRHLNGKPFKGTPIMQKWLGPAEYNPATEKAQIWTTRWYPDNPVMKKRAEEHAYIENEERENGTWDRKKWEYPA